MATTIPARLQIKEINSLDTTTVFLAREPLFASDSNEFYMGTGIPNPNKIKIGNSQAIEGLGLETSELTLPPFSEQTIQSVGGDIFEVKVLDKSSTQNKKVINHQLNNTPTSPFTYSSGIKRNKDGVSRQKVYSKKLDDTILENKTFNIASLSIPSWYHTVSSLYSTMTIQNYKNLLSSQLFTNGTTRDNISSYVPPFYIYKNMDDIIMISSQVKNILSSGNSDFNNSKRNLLCDIYILDASTFSIKYNFTSNRIGIDNKCMRPMYNSYYISGSSTYPISTSGLSNNLEIGSHCGFIKDNFLYLGVNYSNSVSSFEYYIMQKIDLSTGDVVLEKKINNRLLSNIIDDNNQIIFIETEGDYVSTSYNANIIISRYNYDFNIISNLYSGIIVDKSQTIGYQTDYQKIKNNEYIINIGHNYLMYLNTNNNNLNNVFKISTKNTYNSYAKDMFTCYYNESTDSIYILSVYSHYSNTNCAVSMFMLDENRNLINLLSDILSGATYDLILSNSNTSATAYSYASTILTIYYDDTIINELTFYIFSCDTYTKVLLHKLKIDTSTNIVDESLILTSSNNKYLKPTQDASGSNYYLTYPNYQNGYYISSSSSLFSTIWKSTSQLSSPSTHSILCNVKLDCTNITELSLQRNSNTIKNGEESTLITFRDTNNTPITGFEDVGLTSLDISDTVCQKVITITDKDGTFTLRLGTTDIMDIIDTSSLATTDEASFIVTTKINDYQFNGSNVLYDISATCIDSTITINIIPKINNSTKADRGFNWVNLLDINNNGTGVITQDSSVNGVDGLLRTVKQLTVEKFTYDLAITDEVNSEDIDWFISNIIFQYSSANITKSISTDVEYEYSGNELLLRNKSSRSKNIEVAITTINE